MATIEDATILFKNDDVNIIKQYFGDIQLMMEMSL